MQKITNDGNKIDNMVSACLECNRHKSTMTLEEFNSIFKKPRIFFKSTVKMFRWFFRVAKHYYFTELSGNIVLLLCSGDKTSQTRDIKKAKKYLVELKSRAIK